MLRSYLIIMAGACIAVGFLFCCHLTGSDDPLDEIADGDEGVGARPFGTGLSSFGSSRCASRRSALRSTRAINMGE